MSVGYLAKDDPLQNGTVSLKDPSRIFLSFDICEE